MKFLYKQSLVLLLIAGFFSCKKDNNPIPVPKITGEGFVVQTTPGAFGGVGTRHYLTTLDSGTADVAYGQEIPVPYINELSYGTNGAYFIMADGLSKFTRFIPDAKGILREDVSMFVSSFPSQTGAGGKCWYDNNTLLLWSYGGDYPNLPVAYALIDVSGDMKILSKGSFQIPFSDTTLLQTVDFAVKRDNKVFLGYHEVAPDYEPAATGVKIAVMDAQTLTYEKTIVDNRSELAGYGIINMAYVSENGDIYIIPEARITNTPQKPSGVLRIKSGETDLDPSYFFELSPQLEGNDARGLYYIGNGQLLTKVWNKNINSDVGDGYFNGYVWEEYLIDLNTKTATKLNAPPSRGYSSDVVHTKSGKWAFIVNTPTGNFIYLYNPATGATTKGLEYLGVSTIDAINALQ